MELYKVLLVDDEEDIRVGISQKMDWAGLGFTLVGEAENGQDALELAETLSPDVVLTDIKMSFMDGLELCRILTIRLPAAKFVVFSGFDDFEYAKQAIQMNVSEYILKPINAAELSAVLQKLRTELDRERTERQDLENLRSRYEESLPVLRELFYAHLLEGRVPSGQELEQARRLDIDLTGDSWTAALAYIGSDVAKDAMRSLSVQQLLDENTAGLAGCTCKTFLYNDYVALLASCQKDFSVYDLIQSLDRVCTLAGTYLDLTLTVGVGAPCTQLSGVTQSAAGARSALDYRALVGRGRAIYIGDLEPDSGGQLSFDEADEQSLANAIRLGDPEEIRSVVDGLTDKLRSANPSAEQYNFFFLELQTFLLKLTRRADLSLEEVFGPSFTGTVQATSFPTLEALADWCAERCLRIQSAIRRRRTDSAGRTVELAKDFIHRHYGDSSLSVETLCAYLHLSPAYFSTLFKRETGMSFTACVTVARMEAAAEALRNTQEKTYLIAHQCGYEDPNYFSYVFKKHFGVTPTKYRAGSAN
jgi:two-component system response regulator YesN